MQRQNLNHVSLKVTNTELLRDRGFIKLIFWLAYYITNNVIWLITNSTSEEYQCIMSELKKR